MSQGVNHQIPNDGLKGLKQNWRNDVIASLSVALVSLPLSLVISIASGAPPLAGVIAVAVGAFITTFIRGSHIAINGPGNALILLIAASVSLWNEVDAEGQIIAFSGFKYVLGAIITAGGLQFLFGLLGLGKFAEMVPTSVVHGLLAAIGVMIMGKQLHVVIGVEPITGSSPDVTYLTGINSIDYLLEIPESIMRLNPAIAIVGVLAIVIMFIHPLIKSKLVHFIPSPLWVILIVLPVLLIFNIEAGNTLDILGVESALHERSFLHIPPVSSIELMFPDFSKINTSAFWILSLSIAFISSVEGLSSAKAVEKLDPYRRTVNKNRDLIGLGLGTIASGFIGGLPVVTVIARSSVNVNHGAQTRWSNFFQGIFLLLFIVFLGSVLNLLPQSVLAAILVYTGYKLNAPNVYFDVKRKGNEQLYIMLVTYVATLVLGLIPGVLIGMLITAVFQWQLSGMRFNGYFLRASKLQVKFKDHEDFDNYLQIKGVVNFLSLPTLMKHMAKIPRKNNVVLNFKNVTLIDHTVLEYIHTEEDRYNAEGGKMWIFGLHELSATSRHPDALRVKRALKDKTGSKRMSRRQKKLLRLSNEQGYSFSPEYNYDLIRFRKFHFFETRPMEYRVNSLKGYFEKSKSQWEVTDLTFDEGLFQVHEEYHTTVQVISTNMSFPQFSIENEDVFDKMLKYAGYQEMDFKIFTRFSSQFVVKAQDEGAVTEFFTPEIIEYLEQNDVYHIECDGTNFAIFKQIRLASPAEIYKLVLFGRGFMDRLVGYK